MMLASTRSDSSWDGGDECVARSPDAACGCAALADLKALGIVCWRDVLQTAAHVRAAIGSANFRLTHRRGRHLGGCASHADAFDDVQSSELVVHVALGAGPGVTSGVAALAADGDCIGTAPQARDNFPADGDHQRAAVLFPALFVVGRHILADLRVNRVIAPNGFPNPNCLVY